MELNVGINELMESNKKLQEKLVAMELEVESIVSAAVAKAVNQATKPLSEELDKAYNEIARLKAIINKDSTNSSKPSSTNGFKAIPNSREESEKPKGGQKGHQGHRLSLPENIEELEKAGIVERRVNDYTYGGSEYISRFTIDVETKVIITEHRFSKGTKLPQSLYNEVSYGDNLKATTIMLLNEGIIAEKRLSGIISELTQGVVNLSPATMNNIQKQFAQSLEESGELQAIKQNLLDGEIMHTDDTSVRTTEKIVYPENEEGDEKATYVQVKKKSCRVTVRTHSNDCSTLYTANPKKDKKGVERDGILPNYIGILCHDHERKFYNYGTAHATCGAHLIRERAERFEKLRMG